MLFELVPHGKHDLRTDIVDPVLRVINPEACFHFDGVLTKLHQKALWVRVIQNAVLFTCGFNTKSRRKTQIAFILNEKTPLDPDLVVGITPVHDLICHELLVRNKVFLPIPRNH